MLGNMGSPGVSQIFGSVGMWEVEISGILKPINFRNFGELSRLGNLRMSSSMGSLGVPESLENLEIL